MNLDSHFDFEELTMEKTLNAIKADFFYLSIFHKQWIPVDQTGKRYNNKINILYNSRSSLFQIYLCDIGLKVFQHATLMYLEAGLSNSKQPNLSSNQGTELRKHNEWNFIIKSIMVSHPPCDKGTSWCALQSHYCLNFLNLSKPIQYRITSHVPKEKTHSEIINWFETKISLNPECGKPLQQFMECRTWNSEKGACSRLATPPEIIYKSYPEESKHLHWMIQHLFVRQDCIEKAMKHFYTSTVETIWKKSNSFEVMNWRMVTVTKEVGHTEIPPSLMQVGKANVQAYNSIPHLQSPRASTDLTIHLNQLGCPEVKGIHMGYFIVEVLDSPEKRDSWVCSMKASILYCWCWEDCLPEAASWVDLLLPGSYDRDFVEFCMRFDMQKVLSSFCCYSSLSPRVIQPKFGADLDGNLAGACCMSCQLQIVEQHLYGLHATCFKTKISRIYAMALDSEVLRIIPWCILNLNNWNYFFSISASITLYYIFKNKNERSKKLFKSPWSSSHICVFQDQESYFELLMNHLLQVTRPLQLQKNYFSINNASFYFDTYLRFILKYVEYYPNDKCYEFRRIYFFFFFFFLFFFFFFWGGGGGWMSDNNCIPQLTDQYMKTLIFFGFFFLADVVDMLRELKKEKLIQGSPHEYEKETNYKHLWCCKRGRIWVGKEVKMDHEYIYIYTTSAAVQFTIAFTQPILSGHWRTSCFYC
ncbi:hypothetical protein VP01_496g2 [Puccinia sorghi]|uniref:Uncharacterized protein n=1 Tax=Puccinia sorghi TaxID=27349 RepID=A0A0L6ULU5_9BASI|nr:hypothetical protein VP01_496g2 [Puccinia sorghi]